MAPLSRRRILQTGTAITLLGAAGCLTSTPSGETIDYESLTAKGKSLFRRMVADGSIERRSDEIPSRLWEAERVRYRETVYRVTRTATDRNVAEHSLDLSTVSKDEVDTSQLVSYSDLSPEAKGVFERTLDEGGYTTRGRSLPGDLNGHEFVERDGRYYRLRVVVGDIRIWNLSARAANN